MINSTNTKKLRKKYTTDKYRNTVADQLSDVLAIVTITAGRRHDTTIRSFHAGHRVVHYPSMLDTTNCTIVHREVTCRHTMCNKQYQYQGLFSLYTLVFYLSVTFDEKYDPLCRGIVLY